MNHRYPILFLILICFKCIINVNATISNQYTIKNDTIIENNSNGISNENNNGNSHIRSNSESSVFFDIVFISQVDESDTEDDIYSHEENSKDVKSNKEIEIYNNMFKGFQKIIEYENNLLKFSIHCKPTPIYTEFLECFLVYGRITLNDMEKYSYIFTGSNDTLII